MINDKPEEWRKQGGICSYRVSNWISKLWGAACGAAGEREGREIAWQSWRDHHPQEKTWPAQTQAETMNGVDIYTEIRKHWVYPPHLEYSQWLWTSNHFTVNMTDWMIEWLNDLITDSLNQSISQLINWWNGWMCLNLPVLMYCILYIISNSHMIE